MAYGAIFLKTFSNNILDTSITGRLQNDLFSLNNLWKTLVSKPRISVIQSKKIKIKYTLEMILLFSSIFQQHITTTVKYFTKFDGRQN